MQTTSSPTAVEFPSAFVTAAQEELIVNQISLSPNTPYNHAASSGQTVVGHPGASIGMGPSHNQVTGMGPYQIRMGTSHIQVTGLTYPGNQLQYHSLRSPSAPILLEPLQQSPTSSTQLPHTHREHLAESKPVLRSNTIPISHPPPPFSSLLTHPSPQPTNRQPLLLAPLRPHSYHHRTAVYPPYLAQRNSYYYGSVQVPPAAVTMATKDVNFHPVPTLNHPVVRYAVSSQPSHPPQYITTPPSLTPQPAASLSSSIQLKPVVAFTKFAFDKKPILACLKQ